MSRTFQTNRWKIFVLTFLSYALYHASRKVFSAIKSEMANKQWLSSKYYQRDDQVKMDGVLDTLFMLCYAIGLFGNGYIGDRVDSKLLICFGMWLSASMVFLFGAGTVVNIHALGYYAVIWAINGAVQSTGWPANVSVMARWYGADERGFVMGLWSANSCCGNILGTFMVVCSYAVFGENHGWIASLFVVAFFVALEAACVYKYLIPDPTVLSYSHDDNVNAIDYIDECDSFTDESSQLELIKGESKSNTNRQNIRQSNQINPLPQNLQRPIPFIEAWLIPGVIPYALCHACIKAVNYALFFWLPFYLKNSFKMSEKKSNSLSMLFDVGQILGGFACGYAIDKISLRSPIIALMLFLACGAIRFLSETSEALISSMLIITGFLLGGPVSLITTAISADLGTHESLKGNTSALSTVTGIIDGTGSIGAALAQYFVGYLAQCHSQPVGCDPSSTKVQCDVICSWDSVLRALFISSCCALICILPLVKREIYYHT